ncbi:MAG TPA: hypothetical protein PLB18_25095, partial [Acidobacteriota bacterium]|nr:hypothetical protein [Acidobacteriota bacterium]
MVAGGILDQEPVLAGKAVRLRSPLFGYQPRQNAPNFSVAVLGVNGRNDVGLQGGLAVGLSEGCLLTPIRQKSQPKLNLQVISVTGINRCRAKIVTGSEASLQVGDLCEVEQWMLSPTEMLRVWHPPATLPASSLVQIGKMM